MLYIAYSYFSFQPVLSDWCNKGHGMCHHVCGMIHLKNTLPLIGKSSPCCGSGFPLSLSEWSSTHFSNLRLYGGGHMVKDHSYSERGNPLPPHGLLFPFSSKGFLYAISHREDSTYLGLYYTSRGALAGTRNSSMGPPHEGSIRRPIAPCANALTTELHLAAMGSEYVLILTDTNSLQRSWFWSD